MMAFVPTHRSGKRVSDGKYYPLGATLSLEGVNFALFSQNASEVFLLLFDRPDGDPTDILRLENRTKYIWHGFVHGIKAGQLYGYQVKGPFDPGHGMRFNEHKLLLDPYAKALTGKFVNQDSLLLAYDAGSPLRDLSQDGRENTPIVPKSIVISGE